MKRNIRKNIKLNEEQQKLVTQYYPLIFRVLQKYGYLKDNAMEKFNEDWYGIAAIGLCLAARDFDESRGVKFETFACNYIEHEIIRHYRIYNTQVRNQILFHLYYADAPCQTKDVDVDNIWEIIPGNENVENTVVLKILAEGLLAKEKKEKTVTILKLYMNGYTSVDIAKMMGISQQAINARIHKFANKIKKQYSCLDELQIR